MFNLIRYIVPISNRKLVGPWKKQTIQINSKLLKGHLEGGLLEVQPNTLAWKASLESKGLCGLKDFTVIPSSAY